LKAETQRETQLQQATREFMGKVETFNDRLEAAAAKNPDLYDKINPDLVGMTPTDMLPPFNRNVPISASNHPPGPDNDIAQSIVESENPLELMVYLSENPDELTKLQRMPSARAIALRMGTLSARLERESTPAPKAVVPSEPSKAKPPVTPVSGSAQHTEEDVTDDMSLEEHIRIMNARDMRARRAR
jgi:hypothetical protein